ncbi:MAG: hypothetical protein IJC43_00605, partial [Clostridia bacterium]|nr:hypothetical protein [Clostridia bacterium]
PAGETRLARVARAAEGFLLLDCGGREERLPALAAALRRHTDLPLLLPCGTQEEDPSAVCRLAACGNGVVFDLPAGRSAAEIGAAVAGMRRAVDAVCSY